MSLENAIKERRKMEEEEKHIIVKYSYPGWMRVGDSKITFVWQNETVHLFARFDAFFNPLSKKEKKKY